MKKACVNQKLSPLLKVYSPEKLEEYFKDNQIDNIESKIRILEEIINFKENDLTAKMPREELYSILKGNFMEGEWRYSYRCFGEPKMGNCEKCSYK